MFTGDVTAPASVFVTCQPIVPALTPVWMVPPIVEGVPTETVAPVLEVKVSTVSVPVDDRATAKAAEPLGAVFVSVPPSETVVLTSARGVTRGEVKVKL